MKEVVGRVSVPAERLAGTEARPAINWFPRTFLLVFSVREERYEGHFQSRITERFCTPRRTVQNDSNSIGEAISCRNCAALRYS